MAREIKSALFQPGGDPWSQHQIYNALDCAVTLEIFEELSPQLEAGNRANIYFDPQDAFVNWSKLSKEERAGIVASSAQLTYNFERAMQGPALELMLRGFRVDLYWRDKSVALLRSQDARLTRQLNRFAFEVWGKDLNPNSHAQLKAFFYGVMRLPEQYKYDKGEKKVTTDRDALEKLADRYFYSRPFINHILAIKEVRKKISVLTTEVDADRRMRTSYNVTGTESGRWSSSKSAAGTGTNLQNITEELRRAFVADPGYKLGYVDLSQAESFAMGWLIWLLFGDSVYLDACGSGDLHTSVARLVWPSLPWTGERRADRDIAERAFYRHFTFRDMSKRGGHGTNYYGTPPTMARHLHVTTAVMETFQTAYFAAFPGIRRYHLWCGQQLGIHQFSLTPLGMGRHFFSRPNDDSTLRELIAHLPQSMVAQLLNLALYRIWKAEPRAILLAQIHDAIVFQYKEESEQDVLPTVQRLMSTPLHYRGRTLTIPSDIAVGWNWQKQDPEKKLSLDGNPDGLRKWTGSDTRKRTESPDMPGLDRLAA